jgi:hypothetical protein
MSDEELDKKCKEIIDNSLEKLEFLLEEIKILDSVIKENQIRRFKIEWDSAIKNGYKPNEMLKSNIFRDKCKYLFNRMNDENRIEQRIVELYSSTISELRNLK